MIESQFEELKAVVERAKREVTEILEGEEKQALKQAEGIRVHLEQRCTELKKTQTQVEKLSKNKNDVDFLQVTPSRWRSSLVFTGCVYESWFRLRVVWQQSATLFLFLKGSSVCSAGIFRMEERSR